MNNEGIVYRPPSEALSLIVQVTIGCSHNRCRFCTMYKDKKFKVRSMEEIKQDFFKAREQYGDLVEKVFLADGDVLVLPTEQLLEILTLLRNLFPRLRTVTAYGSPKNILRKPLENLRALSRAGLSMIYMGAESGDAQVLIDIQKGVTREEIIEAGTKLKTTGIPSSITLISGLGGKERLNEHASESADLVSRIKPEFVAFLTLLADPAAPIARDIQEGKLTLLSPEETVTELELFLKQVDADGTVFRANHASNYLMLKGTLNREIPSMLNQIDAVKQEKNFRHENWRGL